MDERESAIAAEQESGETQLSETRKSAAENRKALESAQEEADAIRNIIAGHTMKMQGRIEREKETGEQHVSLTMEMNNLDSRIRLLGEMEKEYEGFNKAVRTVMQASERKALRGVRGPVANLMKVDKKYAVAIEIALGAGLQNIVVEREEDAKSAIQLLKQRDGRTRDVPAALVDPRRGVARCARAERVRLRRPCERAGGIRPRIRRHFQESARPHGRGRGP